LQTDFADNYLEQKLTLRIDIEAAAELFYKHFNNQFRLSGPESIGLKTRDTILPRFAFLLGHLPAGKTCNREITLAVDINGRLVIK